MTSKMFPIALRRALLTCWVVGFVACVTTFMSPDYSNAATISPGGSNAIGTRMDVSFNPAFDDVLEIEYNGVGNDLLELSTFADAGGRLEFRQIGGFVPTAGYQFDFLSGSQVLVGERFDSVTWPNAIPGLALSLGYPAMPFNESIGVEFVLPQAATNTMTSGSWGNAAIWNLSGSIPDLDSDVTLINPGALNAMVSVDSENAFANSVEISALGLQPMTLQMNSNRILSAIQGVNLESGGVLTGLGTIVGNVKNSAGVIYPGVSPNTPGNEISIDGFYSQGATSTLRVDLRDTVPAMNSDHLAVSGGVQLNGSLEVILVGGKPAIGTRFTVIESLTSVTGTFQQVNAPGVGSYYVDYGQNDVVFVSTDDFNMDRSDDHLVNADDIDDFLLALIDPGAYEDLHKVSPAAVGDWINADDGFVDFDDIPGFEQKLMMSAGISVSILGLLGIPEPTSFVLLLSGVLTYASLHRKLPCSAIG